MRVQQAIAIIQEKLEGQIIGRRPDFNLAHRLQIRFKGKLLLLTNVVIH